MIDIYIKKIPEQLKPELIEIIKRVQLNKFRAPRTDVEYLFNFYKTYLAPHDRQDIECRACRAKVTGIFFQILRTWETTKHN